MQKQPVDFSTHDRNGKEMEEGERRRKNLQYLEINVRIKEKKKSHRASVMNLRKQKTCIGFGEQIELSELSV